MDWALFWTAIGVVITVIGVGIAVIGFVYGFLRNFKVDIKADINNMNLRINTLEERMFWLATGKTLKDAILEERMKLETNKGK
jgi:hypothetical protein